MDPRPVAIRSRASVAAIGLLAADAPSARLFARIEPDGDLEINLVKNYARQFCKTEPT
jgi:hypothetical protein